jgi:hypothetical protein
MGTRTKKKFDCVEMMHGCGAAVQEKLKGMTVEEQARYWEQRNRELISEQERGRERGVK